MEVAEEEDHSNEPDFFVPVRANSGNAAGSGLDEDDDDDEENSDDEFDEDNDTDVTQHRARFNN